jgi:hypothetical protein
MAAYIYSENRTIMYIYAAILNRKWKTEAQMIFLNHFTICSSCKQKFVVCPFVDEQASESYPFANELNELAHLCVRRRV